MPVTNSTKTPSFPSKQELVARLAESPKVIRVASTDKGQRAVTWGVQQCRFLGAQPGVRQALGVIGVGKDLPEPPEIFGLKKPGQWAGRVPVIGQWLGPQVDAAVYGFAAPINDLNKPHEHNLLRPIEHLRDFNYAARPSAYDVDFARASELFGYKIESLEDLFGLYTETGPNEVVRVTPHLLGLSKDQLQIVPYDDKDGLFQGEMTRFIPPDQIAIFIKHRAFSPDADITQRVKLQCAHIGVAVGVETPRGEGVLTVNNPQGYQDALFGEPDYPMICVKPKLPDSLSPAQKKKYIDNIRTWLVIANTFSEFPPDYDGDDPLGTRSVADTRMLGEKLLQALAGNPKDRTAARAWLKDPKNQIYCSELAHVVLNLGLNFPLNRPNVGDRLYSKVAEALEEKKFLRLNANDYIPYVKLTMAPDDLPPLTAELSVEETEPEGTEPFGRGLAVRPFTLADMMEVYLQTHMPRDEANEDEKVAAGQALMLRLARDELLANVILPATVRNNLVPPEVVRTQNEARISQTYRENLEAAWAQAMQDPKVQELVQLYDKVIEVVRTQHASYGAFRQALAPYMDQIRLATLPREPGTGAFVPPHLFLVRTKESMERKDHGGLVDWQYVFHGIHDDMVKKKDTLADILAGCLQAYAPRETANENEEIVAEHEQRLRQVSAELLEKVILPAAARNQPLPPEVLETEKQTLIHQTNVDNLKKAWIRLFDDIIEVVGTKHASYGAFRQALAPYLEKLRAVTVPGALRQERV